MLLTICNPSAYYFSSLAKNVTSKVMYRIETKNIINFQNKIRPKHFVPNLLYIRSEKIEFHFQIYTTSTSKFLYIYQYVSNPIGYYIYASIYICLDLQSVPKTQTYIWLHISKYKHLFIHELPAFCLFNFVLSAIVACSGLWLATLLEDLQLILREKRDYKGLKFVKLQIKSNC